MIIYRRDNQPLTPEAIAAATVIGDVLDPNDIAVVDDRYVVLCERKGVICVSNYNSQQGTGT